jgi:pyruvate formate lyase activating enzyme
MIRGRIFDLRRYSIHDGPGIRTTVFLQGCPLSCAWCHNPEGRRLSPFIHLHPDRCIGCAKCVEICPEEALDLTNDGVRTDLDRCLACGTCTEVCPALARELVGREWSATEVVAEVEKDRPFFEQSSGGVTFSGGEPLSQPEFLLELLRGCGARGLHRAVDTSGFAPRPVVDRIAEETDLFLFDLKLMDSRRHPRITGVPNDQILANLRHLSGTGAALQLRIPLIGGINDDDENIERMIGFIAILPSRPAVTLLPFHASARDKHRRFSMPWRLEGSGAVSEEKVRDIAGGFDEVGLRVEIGGG